MGEETGASWKMMMVNDSRMYSDQNVTSRRENVVNNAHEPLDKFLTPTQAFPGHGLRGFSCLLILSGRSLI